jgi:hypothetical protein
MLIRIRSSVTDERRKAEAAQLANAIERDRGQFFKVVKTDPDRAAELDHHIHERMQELYHRTRDAAKLDR